MFPNVVSLLAVCIVNSFILSVVYFLMLLFLGGDGRFGFETFISIFVINLIVFGIAHVYGNMFSVNSIVLFVFVIWLIAYLLILIPTIGIGYGIGGIAFSLPLSLVAIPLAVIDWFLFINRRKRGG